MTPSWSDWTKWRMDLVKALLQGVLAFLLGYLLLDQLTQARTEERAICAATIKRMDDAALGFQVASHAYAEAANDAYVALYEWKQGVPPAELRNYWGKANDDAVIAIESMERQFKEDKSIQQALRSLVDTKQEAHAILDAQADAITDGSPPSREELDLQREVHDPLLEKFRSARRVILQEAETVLRTPASQRCRIKRSAEAGHGRP